MKETDRFFGGGDRIYRIMFFKRPHKIKYHDDTTKHDV